MGAVVRRVTNDLEPGKITQDILIKEQPTGHDWHAALPFGVRSASARLHWQPAS